ncbi:hypothetical protein [Deinococcus sp. S9]|uniref:hypothetical protein n=1 Tax=Deinococcus sp. S9 TaxID=2545754 RepID=UPI0010544A43|nr:hypothetical protein [Deinococcus sp. S9]TDE85315.1 hypothetical protein E0686_12335 [Deinococcus sp. S9]
MIDLPREEGTSIPKWVLGAIADLSNASDIKVLMFLASRSRYRRSGFGPGELSDELGLDYRTTTASLRRLGDLGHTVSAEGVHALRGACAAVAQRLHKSTPTRQGKNAVQDGENEKRNSPKDLEGLRRTLEEENTPPTPQGEEARDSTAPGGGGEVHQPAAQQEPLSPDGEAADAAAADLPSPDQVQPQRRARGNGKATSTEKVPAAAGASTPFQELFAAVALACYGGEDALTNTARSRVATAAKSLSKAKYVAADVPQIVAWLHATESWRDALTPGVIEERAPAWRGSVRGSLPARPAKPHVMKFTPPAPVDESGEIDMAALMANGPLNGTRR